MSAVRKRSNFYKENSQRMRESDGLTGRERKRTYIYDFTTTTNLVPQLGYFFFNIKTTEYLYQLVESCHFINYANIKL